MVDEQVSRDIYNITTKDNKAVVGHKIPSATPKDILKAVQSDGPTPVNDEVFIICGTRTAKDPVYTEQVKEGVSDLLTHLKATSSIVIFSSILPV